MSDNTENTDVPRSLEATPMPITIHTQYVRDVSFENPNAPDSLRGSLEPPTMDVNIGMDARTLEDPKIKHLYEVVVTLSAKATRQDKTVFIAEVIYAGVASVDESVPEDQHHPICLIEIPRHIFPYARQILSEMTSLGGYPPLLLNPVDFQALYFERFKEEIQATMKDSDKKGDVKNETAQGNA